MNASENRRILLVDDMPAINEDYRKILAGDAAAVDLAEAAVALFGGSTRATAVHFELESAYQGVEAADKVHDALLADRPYCYGIRRHAHAAGVGRGGDDRAPVAGRSGASDCDLHRLFGLLLEGSIKPARRAGSAAHSEESLSTPSLKSTNSPAQRS